MKIVAIIPARLARVIRGELQVIFNFKEIADKSIISLCTVSTVN